MLLAYQNFMILELFVPLSIGSSIAGMEVKCVGLCTPYSLLPLFKNKKEKTKYLGLHLDCCYCSSLFMTPQKQNHRITEEGTLKDHLVQLVMVKGS